jgi:uncharacterized membrane protein
VEAPGIGLTTEAFCYRDGMTTRIPLPNGYSHVHAEAISDRADVVGYAGRAQGLPRLVAFVWNADSGRMERLDALDGATACHAFDISADGRVVVGYSTGLNRMVPCVWQRGGDDQRWHVTPLPTIHQYNPFLLSSRVVISDNGQRIAACLTVRMVPGAIPKCESEVFEWRRRAAGPWQRQRRLPHAARLGDINDQGMLVGSMSAPGGWHAFVSSSDSAFAQLGFGPGTVAAQATDVNNAGLVVGYRDGAGQPDGGLRAFCWQAGTLELIRFPGDVLLSAALAVNDRQQIAGYLITRDDDSRWGKTVSFVLSSGKNNAK